MIVWAHRTRKSWALSPCGAWCTGMRVADVLSSRKKRLPAAQSGTRGWAVESAAGADFGSGAGIRNSGGCSNISFGCMGGVGLEKPALPVPVTAEPQKSPSGVAPEGRESLGRSSCLRRAGNGGNNDDGCDHGGNTEDGSEHRFAGEDHERKAKKEEISGRCRVGFLTAKSAKDAKCSKGAAESLGRKEAQEAQKIGALLDYGPVISGAVSCSRSARRSDPTGAAAPKSKVGGVWY